MMPVGLPADAQMMNEQMAPGPMPMAKGADPMAERRRMMLAQMLAGAGQGGNPWQGAGAAVGQLAGEGINRLMGATG